MHHNKLLAKLGRADRQNLLRCGEIVQLEAGAVLHKAGLPSANAYFPIAGAFALVGGLAEGPHAGLALVGRESMLGIHLVLGDRISPVGCVVQSRAVAHRVDAEALDAALVRSRHLKCLLLAYVGFCMNQITLAVACAPRYTTVQRLAGWLLASCKLMEADTLSSTQCALATMLGVSRGQLNRAASELQRRGVVQVGRGGLTVLNATGLREIACSCDTGAQAMTR